ncbi:MAG: FtsX-like permease family protein, partial [Pseudomonadota bacterium]
ILLGLLGGAGGWLLSACACGLIRAWMVGWVQRFSSGAHGVFFDLTPDWRVLVYAITVSLLTGVVVGLWPALRVTRANLETGLKLDVTSVGRGARGPWSRRNLLLTTQVAACLFLLAGAGLLFRGASHALSTDPGFDAKHLFLMEINAATVAPTAAARTAILQETLARVTALPGVEQATWTGHPPYVGHSIQPFLTDEDQYIDGCVMNDVAANYFETLGIALVAGRSFTREEQETKAPVIVISESAARHLWPGKDPLGRRLAHMVYSNRNQAGPPDMVTVIGVTKDARLTLLSQTDKIDLFFPVPVQETRFLLVRTRGAPETMFHSAITALREIDATLPSQASIMSMEKGPMELQRLMAEAPAMAASLLGAVALLLASVGIYGVVSFLVARRTREIGVHLALGAQRGDIIQRVLRQTLRPVGWGAAIGLAGGMGLCVMITKLVLNPEIPDLTYGAGAFPSATLVGVLGLLLGVILLAAFIPARRATKVDPMIALRAE